RFKAARVPSLVTAVERLVQEKGRVEDAVGFEGKRVSNEQRRSRAWREQVDELSLQARKENKNEMEQSNADRCRVLQADKADLERHLSRLSDLLQRSKEKGLRADSELRELRVSALEARLLREELEAVRDDCGRLVQLIGSTTEYAQFRRLWDDSGGLTRIGNRYQHVPPNLTNNADVTIEAIATLCEPQKHRRPVGRWSQPSPLPPPPPLSGNSTSVEGFAPPISDASHTSGRRCRCWDQAMRSEWSSPADKILAATAPPALTATVSSGRSSRAANHDEGNHDSKDLRHAQQHASTHTPNLATGHTITSRQLSEDQRGQSQRRSGRALRAAGQTEGFAPGASGMKAPAWEGGRDGKGAPPAAMPPAGGNRGGGEAEGVVRWGRVDLLSVLYPPPTQITGAVTPLPKNAVGELSMWVPREAAGLCRQFVSAYE
ncbi:unnamed protein product, partial [Sphacelaria rigidula]